VLEMAKKHHSQCLRRAQLRRNAGMLSRKFESIALTDRVLRKIFDAEPPTRKQIEEAIMPKAQHGKDVTARYILSRYFGHPRKILDKMSDAECQLFLNKIGVQ
jgi:hypothetical protein